MEPKHPSEDAWQPCSHARWTPSPRPCTPDDHASFQHRLGGQHHKPDIVQPNQPHPLPLNNGFEIRNAEWKGILELEEVRGKHRKKVI
ncbi:hypothetical protein AHAS_Ahas19G0192600 [Arachis hypogaea]